MQEQITHISFSLILQGFVQHLSVLKMSITDHFSEPGSTINKAEVTSATGEWGSYTGKQFCPEGYFLSGARAKSEPGQGSSNDDSAGTCLPNNSNLRSHI